MKINGVFQGGGVKGVALAGAVDAAQQRGFEFDRVAGTSSGSIIAAFLAAGYTGEEMKRMIIDMPFRNFLKRAPIYNTRFIGPAARLLLKKGLYSGEALEYWVLQKLAARGVRTFGDLQPGQLRIIASDISRGKLLVLPDDIAQYGIDPAKFLIAKAVRMSSSIPYFFDPVIIKRPRQPHVQRSKEESDYLYIVDGGLLSNFPLWLFDQQTDPGPHRPTIGFQLVGRTNQRVRQIRGPIAMLTALFATMMDAHDDRYIDEANRFRTVKIPTHGVRVTQFDITPEQSAELFDAGRDSAGKFFTRWSHDMYEADYAKYVARTPPGPAAENDPPPRQPDPPPARAPVIRTGGTNKRIS
ncbi:patatin-like phospholipase family protein [Gordoniibacillus kamchatkensis]|uniref:patatin-like phospholipase family protein n=1 Tax=Gordoniibacillus kamchatkensis TaxID=1590651 RepID=UPI0009E3DFCC|nr:patatin-like phospholipase family protein [Paenibacillus sp. VKM B-2647]